MYCVFVVIVVLFSDLYCILCIVFLLFFFSDLYCVFVVVVVVVVGVVSVIFGAEDRKQERKKKPYFIP